jgi:hypothetical protein
MPIFGMVLDWLDKPTAGQLMRHWQGQIGCQITRIFCQPDSQQAIGEEATNALDQGQCSLALADTNAGAGRYFSGYLPALVSYPNVGESPLAVEEHMAV